MAAHRQITIATDMPIYFCDPASPWQRGTNENTNGLLRQYFPKGTDLVRAHRRRPRPIADELNGRPRKTLDGPPRPKRSTALLSDAQDHGVATTT